ncbi:alginate lyase family protein [Salegentibacter sp. BDJ18]|uniref:alginate lyase family protein n=1 Tax=Salegentibacter sp. BDJ18 TaxID=2816376 RepID=UPI001AAF0708|nr:alginate lyase family protein [Salegentibacter sp. BDJ18]MBO2543177.1 alginate lyase family protein [Salegentibacter sp. BDJ18]
MKLITVNILLFLALSFGNTFSWAQVNQSETYKQEVIEVLRDKVLSKAAWALEQEPITITTSKAERSAGGIHDFYSEGDYWWPDPKDPDGPYIQRDGETNPENFTAHRKAMIRFSQIIGALASAYEVTGEAKYVEHAFKHLQAWFMNNETKMNPSLNYAQAIKGRVTGRGIGIIDTIHLMEVAQGLLVMRNFSEADPLIVSGVKKWFRDYLEWLTTHPYGIEEMNWKNNHSTSWVMQVASFSRLTENEDLLEFCRDRYRDVLLPKQMAMDGSFPLELERTKPYGYSLFNLDAMTAVVHILSDDDHNLWEYETESGKSIRKGIKFLYPYVADKGKWPYRQDVMYWNNWPVAQPFLLFGAEKYENFQWFNTWKELEHYPSTREVIRNLPIRNPIIWL